MNFDQFVSEYIAEDHDVEQLSVMVLEGWRAWYPLAAEAEKQKLQEVMEKAARAAADAHRFGRYGFFLYDQTGEEQYRTWIERNAEWLKNSPQSENGVFGCVEDSSRNISGSVMFAVYPFYMEYETRYHNKAEYANITNLSKRFLRRPSEIFLPPAGIMISVKKKVQWWDILL